MKSQGLACTPSAVANLKGDAARAAFINHFKEVQRLKTQLDQYTDLTEENKPPSSRCCRTRTCAASRASIWRPPRKLKEQQGKTGGNGNTTDDSWISWISSSSSSPPPSSITTTSWASSPGSQPKGPGKSKMTREELIGLISADAKFMDERDDIAEYIGTLKAGRRPQRNRHPRRLHPLQGGEERPGTRRHRRTARPRHCGPADTSWTASSSA
jgi:type I restriction enzyme R subunit